MRKLYLALTTVAVMLACSPMHAQSIKDLLNNLNPDDAAGSFLDHLTGTGVRNDITGTWEYTGAAVKFTSDNVLMSAASGLASSQIEEKLNEYLQKIGLAPGAFSYEFNSDSTFTTVFKNIKLPGTYSLSQEGGTIGLDYGISDKLKGFSIDAQTSITATTLDLLFNADKILEFLGKISSSTGDSKLSILSSLVGQYDGLKIGFELTKQSTPTR